MPLSARAQTMLTHDMLNARVPRQHTFMRRTALFQSAHATQILKAARMSRGGVAEAARAALLRAAHARALLSPPACYFPTNERKRSWLLHCYTMIWAVLDAP